MTELAIRATLIILFTVTCAYFARGLGVLVPRRVLRVGLVALLSLPILQAYELNWVVLNPFAAMPEPIVMDELGLLFSTPTPKPTSVGLGWLAWVYGIVSLLLVIRGLWGLFQLRNLIKNAETAGLSIMIEADRSLASLGVKRTARILVGDVQSPITFGSINPTIMLPHGFDQWSEHQRAAVLLHESAHVRSFDCAWQRLTLFTNALYWCHPLFWSMARALKEETEVAADAHAIAAGCNSAEYATALVEIARTFNLKGERVPTMGVSFMNNCQLDRRVKSALKAGRRGFAFASLLAIWTATVGSFAIAGLAFVNPKPDVVVVDAFLSEDPMDHLVNIVEKNAVAKASPKDLHNLIVPKTVAKKPPAPRSIAPAAAKDSHSEISIIAVKLDSPVPAMPEQNAKMSRPGEARVVAGVNGEEISFTAAEYKKFGPLAELNKLGLAKASQELAALAGPRKADRLKIAKALEGKVAQLSTEMMAKEMKDLSEKFANSFAPLYLPEPSATKRQVIEMTDSKGNYYRFEVTSGDEITVQVSDQGKVILQKTSIAKPAEAPARTE